ncbi:hypothetical protein WICPIJ_006871 [Wickerhamomyces pijperi]|uniref:Zinc finger Mcm10/DnaG-type domain-containing protein n=1 Tax=Wickerhamomyces pijperi TaxID=599730 RepID=A0A9P8TKK2_WICPI|nr:hypothetical protein WICPIJ_006871 [Wickerhamomyces pijperi]
MSFTQGLKEQEDQLRKQFEEQQRKIASEREELERKVQLKKLKKEQYEKLGGLKYENNPNKPKLPYQVAQSSTIASSSSKTTTSYFLENLESGTKESQRQDKARRQLQNSRIYTFGKAIESQTELVDEKEFFSGIDIRKRYLSNNTLYDLMKDIKVLRLPKLFAKVSPPDFKPPEYPNWCVVGILYHKSDIKMSLNGSTRYITLGLTDFKFNVSVNIFNQQLIEKYNKLIIGDVIAVLNAEVFLNKQTTTFSLSIRHKYDSVLEIASAKHFAVCKHTVYKTGKQCTGYYDKSQDNCCPYHQEQMLSRAASKRMEFQTSTKLTAPTKRGGSTQKILYDSKNGKNYIMDDETAPKTDRISKLAHKFSTPDAHTAYFNPNFVNEKALKEKRERERQKREILQKKKDIMLERKLQRLRDNNYKKEDTIDLELKELEDIRKNKEGKKIDFGPSKYTIDQKRQENKNTKDLLARIKQRKSVENEENKPFQRIKQDPKKLVVLDFDDSDSESDGEFDQEAFKRFKASSSSNSK